MRYYIRLEYALIAVVFFAGVAMLALGAAGCTSTNPEFCDPAATTPCTVTGSDGGTGTDALPSAQPDLVTVQGPDLIQNLPASCLDIKGSSLQGASDGTYTLYVAGNRTKPWSAFCFGMGSQTPVEYLTLVTGPDTNFSQYTAGGYSPGTNVRTVYTKVRIDPVTLLVDISDQTFSTSEGSLDGPEHVQVTSMPFGSAMDCISDTAATGVGNVDLRETPFQFGLHAFSEGGLNKNSNVVFSNENQVANLNGGGECGWESPNTYSPINHTGGFDLKLIY